MIIESNNLLQTFLDAKKKHSSQLDNLKLKLVDSEEKRAESERRATTFKRECNEAKLKIANLQRDYTVQTTQLRESVDLVNQLRRETEKEKPTGKSKETQAEIPTEAGRFESIMFDL